MVGAGNALMTIPIKIECVCGQHYAFDIEADGDHQPGTVACPACGMDGTAATNAIIGRRLAAQPAAAVAPAIKPRIRIAGPPASTQAAAPVARPGAGAPGVAQDNSRNQADIEARAKILWGDSPEEVIKFLMIRGFSCQEASDKVHVLFKERLAEIRANGIVKILTGIFVAVGAATSFLFLVKIGFLSIWLLASAGIACVSGMWMILIGIFKVLTPKSEHGDASDND
jgi:hypothetical protein